MKTKIITDGVKLLKVKQDFRRTATKFEAYTTAIKARSLPLYWDLIYQIFVKGINNATRDYRFRLADTLPSMMERLDTANAYVKIMPFIDANTFTVFPASCVDVSEDGSFAPNWERLDALALDSCSYEVSEDHQRIIEAYNKAFASSTIAPANVTRYLQFTEGGVCVDELGFMQTLGGNVSLADAKAKAGK